MSFCLDSSRPPAPRLCVIQADASAPWICKHTDRLDSVLSIAPHCLRPQLARTLLVAVAALVDVVEAHLRWCSKQRSLECLGNCTVASSMLSTCARDASRRDA
ncbi:unnamed protein product [Parajaminaea phylloscopi]